MGTIRPLDDDTLAFLRNPIAIYRDGEQWVVLADDASAVASACGQSYDQWQGPLVLARKVTDRNVQLLLMRATGRNLVLVNN